MIIRTLTTVAIVAAAIGLAAAQQGTGNKPAQQPPKPTTPAEMSPEDQRHMQDAMPGPIHKHMTGCIGEYTTKTVMTMEGQREESIGKATLRMTLDGRFLVEEGESTMHGAPVQTMKISGYNNGSKEFETVWMYTMSTGMLKMTGSSPDHGKTIKWKGTYKDHDGEQPLIVETKHLDADHFVEKIMHDEAGAGPVMETTFTRKK